MTQVFVGYFMDGNTPIFDGVSTSLDAAKRLSHIKLNEGIEKDHGPVPEEFYTWTDLPDSEGADCDYNNGEWLVEVRIRRTSWFEDPADEI